MNRISLLVPALFIAALLTACSSSTAVTCDPDLDEACADFEGFEGNEPEDAGSGVEEEEPVDEPDPSDISDGGDGGAGEAADAGEVNGSDAGTPTPDAGTPRPDAGTQTPDAGTQTPDAGTQTPDAGTQTIPPIATRPSAPSFPSTIDHLSIAIRTGTGPHDGTNANKISLCLNANRCFTLNNADVDDRQRGVVDVYHFGGVGLRRSDVDRVELRSSEGTDAWAPACVSVQFDGEPKHCSDGLTVRMGSGANEQTVWRAPNGVRMNCTSCYPQPLTHGPIVGITGPQSTKLWVRADATRLVGAELILPGPTYRPVAYAYPRAQDDFTAKLDITGLGAQTEYQFRFTVDGVAQGETATVRTAPPAGRKARTKLAFGSCAKDAFQPIFETIRAVSTPDLMLFVGDNHYGNTGDINGLWTNYRMALERGRQPLLAATPTLAVWDDHDFTGNNTDGTSSKKANALRAFRDFWPNGSFGETGKPGIYSKASWGDLDFFLLDDRYERSPPGTSGGRIIGTDQETWLKAALSASSATFKFVVSGSNFSAGARESWNNFPAARQRLFEHIRTNRIPGVVLLSGDIHRSHFRRILRTGAGAYDLPELVSSPLANNSSACSTMPADSTQSACVSNTSLYVELEIDTTAQDPRIVARIIDGLGAVRATTTVLRSQLQ